MGFCTASQSKFYIAENTLMFSILSKHWYHGGRYIDLSHNWRWSVDEGRIGSMTFLTSSICRLALAFIHSTFVFHALFCKYLFKYHTIDYMSSQRGQQGTQLMLYRMNLLTKLLIVHVVFGGICHDNCTVKIN